MHYHVTDKWVLRLSTDSACSGVRVNTPISLKAALGSVCWRLASLLGSCNAEYSVSFKSIAEPVFRVSNVQASLTLSKHTSVRSQIIEIDVFSIIMIFSVYTNAWKNIRNCTLLTKRYIWSPPFHCCLFTSTHQLIVLYLLEELKGRFYCIVYTCV